MTGNWWSSIVLATLSEEEYRRRVPELVAIYAMARRNRAADQIERAVQWRECMDLTGWRHVVAVASGGEIVGFSFGHHQVRTGWWHEEIMGGRARYDDCRDRWLADYFELSELHVRPDHQGCGLGAGLVRMLLGHVAKPAVLLSTLDAETPAMRLYRSLGFEDVLRNFRFTGDPRSFAVLGRSLPLALE